ncbi:MAG TPA: hypothetical protein VGU71_00935 [Candidatus Dormibacteraeota bacterium]|nr:hypothetical protein [Candidatus Dormibacteraeota bacterium]
MSKKRRNTPLTGHQRNRKVLKPPFAQIPGLFAIDGVRDILPELLWIDALLTRWPLTTAMNVMDEVLEGLDAADPLPDSRLRVGLVSDFLLLNGTPAAVLAKIAPNERMMAFPSGFLEGVALYPEFPARYLVEGMSPEAGVDGAAWLSGAVLRLVDRQSQTGGLRNAVTIRRAVEKGRVAGLPAEFRDSMVKYPHGSDEQNGLVESLARSYLNGTWGLRTPQEAEWAKHFWRRNREIRPCKTREMSRKAA